MSSLLSKLRRRPSSQDLSIVVVSDNTRREIPRTLQSLSIPYQKNIDAGEYEILLVDNGSAQPWTERDFATSDTCVRIVNSRDATSSPAAAVNRGLREANGSLVGALLDGAPMATPGLLDACRRAARLYPRPIVAAPGFHVEDRLLASIDWPRDGYRVFEISGLNASGASGWSRPVAESDALFMPAELWKELGGYDEAFQLPGGGLANLDVYERALALPGTQLIVILGEATFHQVHGGVPANGAWDVKHAEYKQIRGRNYTAPKSKPVYFGRVEGAALRQLDRSIPMARQKTGDTAPAYIELLKKTLLNETNLELELAFLRAREMARGDRTYNESELLDVAGPREDLENLRQARLEGRLFGGSLSNMPHGYTMIGRRRMDNLQFCVESVLDQEIPGDLVECGVWKGGACIFMRGILKAHGVGDRKVWVADSFCGLPPPTGENDEGLDLSQSKFPQLAISLDRVKSYFERFDLLDDQVGFLPGWFSDSLPQAPIETISVLRLDGDLYSSTTDVFRALYDKVAPGGFIIVDDYGLLRQCARATDEFRAARGITTPIERIDITGVFWRKES